MTQRGVGFVLATIFIDSVGFGLIMPVLPRLLMNVGRIDLPQAIESGAWMGLAIAVAMFFSASVLGNLSDRFGRRPVLLVALAGMAIDYLLLAVAGTIPLIFLGRVLSGALGERALFYAAAGLAGINFVYGLTIFPERLPPERRRPSDWRRANPLGALAAARAVPGMTAVAVVLTLWQIASCVYPMTWTSTRSRSSRWCSRA